MSAVVKMVSKNTPVKLELEVTSDKLLIARASSNGQFVMVEPINPFANKELTTEQRIILKAERQANIEAEQNGGKPTKEGLETLYKAYYKIGNSLRAAETLELLNELYPSNNNFNQISLFFKEAGFDNKSLEYAEKAFEVHRHPSTAFNLAYEYKTKDKDKFKEILQDSLKLDPNMP
ncbi:MAG: hypothetical protein IPN88_17735 [Bacteroidetes bacterium]|nr:hypothetical protein [Bacteroidota bacterium]